ncbi:MAG: phosphatidate cytidylyltransferase [Firmicutes bacterium]|nr:phosphatidate cytidylyltransferase [Bacillota bacterium]
MKTRIISALIMAIIVIPILLLGGTFYYIGIGIISFLAYKEILDLKKSHQEIPLFMKLIGLLCLYFFVYTNVVDSSINKVFNYQNIIFLILFLLIPTVFYEEEKYTTKDAFYLIGVILVLGITFNLFIVLRNRNLFLIIYLAIISIVTDTFALISGSLFGKTKLCPKISPNKTWEGSFGGLVCGTIAGVAVYSFFIDPFSVRLVFITAILSIVGQIGDLIMSKIKRENNIKDFSKLMPGHGGILDRFDSLMFVVMAYLVLVFYL